MIVLERGDAEYTPSKLAAMQEHANSERSIHGVYDAAISSTSLP